MTLTKQYVKWTETTSSQETMCYRKYLWCISNNKRNAVLHIQLPTNTEDKERQDIDHIVSNIHTVGDLEATELQEFAVVQKYSVDFSSNSKHNVGAVMVQPSEHTKHADSLEEKGDAYRIQKRKKMMQGTWQQNEHGT